MRAIAGFVSLNGPRNRDWLHDLGRRMTTPPDRDDADPRAVVHVTSAGSVMLAGTDSIFGTSTRDSAVGISTDDGGSAAVLLGEIYRIRSSGEVAGGVGAAFDAGRLLGAVQARPDDLEAALAAIDGAFVAAWHDARTGQVALARDQFGMRPLYWTFVEGAVLFATDFDCLFRTGLVRPAIDPLDFVYRSYCRMESADDYTWYAGIRSLPAASLLRVHGGKVTVGQYWRPKVDELTVPPEEVRAAFLQAVELRSHGERRMAAVLSGGLDSSAVFCALCDLGRDIAPYVVEYQGRGLRQNADVPYAMLAARSRNRVARRCEIRADDLAGMVATVVARVHRPLVHGVELALYQTYEQMASDDRRIAFSGQASDVIWGDQDGADFPILNLQGPVDIHSEFYLRNRLHRLERPVWHVMLDRVMQRLDVCEAEVTERLWERTYALYRDFPGIDPHKRARYHVLGRFSVYVNEMIEALSSEFGIIERTPFQDVQLIDLAFRMPEFVKNHDGITDIKPFLKRALYDIVPRQIVYRPKQGFPPPDDHGFLNSLRRLVSEVGIPFEAKFPKTEFERLGIGELLYLYSAQCWLRDQTGWSHGRS